MPPELGVLLLSQAILAASSLTLGSIPGCCRGNLGSPGPPRSRLWGGAVPAGTRLLFAEVIYWAIKSYSFGE